MSLSKKRVAIIGTREPDENQISLATQASELFSFQGFIIHTGAADGIDSISMANARIPAVHERESDQTLEVYLPWHGYNRNVTPAHAKVIVYDRKLHVEWTESVEKYHPAFGKLTFGAKALHARNFGIVKDVNLVLAFPDEKGGGGTGQGIRVAKSLGIKVLQYNRGSIDSVDKELGKLRLEIIDLKGFSNKAST
jgi:hypothetical protein